MSTKKKRTSACGKHNDWFYRQTQGNTTEKRFRYFADPSLRKRSKR